MSSLFEENSARWGGLRVAARYAGRRALAGALGWRPLLLAAGVSALLVLAWSLMIPQLFDRYECRLLLTARGHVVVSSRPGSTLVTRHSPTAAEVIASRGIQTIAEPPERLAASLLAHGDARATYTEFEEFFGCPFQAFKCAYTFDRGTRHWEHEGAVALGPVRAIVALNADMGYPVFQTEGLKRYVFAYQPIPRGVLLDWLFWYPLAWCLSLRPAAASGWCSLGVGRSVAAAFVAAIRALG